MADCSISIIIPAYNVEKYLKAALDSIKEQTELPDEVILIDDGSTDGTLHVANAFEFPVPYQVLSIENGGQGNARNLGVSLASSEYVYFFDSDDLLTSNFIRSIKDQIRKNEYPDIVLFSGKSFNDAQYDGTRWVDYSRGFSGGFDTLCEFLDKAYANRGLFCSPCLYVSKRSLWGRGGLEFKADYLEDEAVFFPLLFSCKSFFVLDEVFFLRRNRNGSTMTVKANSKHVKGALNCIDSLLRLFREERLSVRERWHLTKRIESYCSKYWHMARQSGSKVSFRKLFEVLFVSRSLGVALIIFLHVSRMEDAKAIVKLKRALRGKL